MHIIEVGTTDNIEGAAYGAGVSIIQSDSQVEGSGPRLHTHPYAETFLIHAGSALFTVDGEELVGRAGHVIVVPPDTPHKFRVLPGGYRATHIHANDTFVTDWLE
ncbi:cupin domain-containing protein [Mumia sp. zg.B21]|uniref:cupin domain-containing protein n=1 Tax=unclassified Mumia TaxID=2621872 RepID=UPI001C6F4994|nr:MULTISPECIES: cupin domain-containing protein [unclassified Mumia]MBW9210342.1 cupin domain-containing protein [Mumia sp. zg.B21]MDD9347318.1 cupin domain-containing protein [Mumia sp.]